MPTSRCPWAQKTDIERDYHDTEWGRPQFDDRKLFEFVILESAQAGLSWLTILKRREGYRERFQDFNPQKVAAMSRADVDEALTDIGIIRNRSKLEAAIGNAKVFCELQAQHGSFSEFIWAYVDGEPQVNHWQSPSELPATTALSDRISKDLKRRGFRFFGSTICYAHMQATGMVNDHLVSCTQHRECQNR